MRKLAIVLSLLASCGLLRAADPIIAYGLTNFALGQAVLEPDYYGDGTYRVTSLRSNGLDGVSILLGEPEGVFLTANSSYLQDGNFMIARAYGQLNGTSDRLLATIQGGRASDTVYPLRLDFSPLGPESVTYQVFYNGALQREFSRGSPLVMVQWGNTIYPTLNPISRRSDGSLGMSLALSQPVNFVFPEILRSAYGDELFIRLNNATNQPGLVSRMEVFGGGDLNDFWFNAIALGMFGRPHQSLNGATLQAAPSRLRLDNLVNTNGVPGVLIKLDRAGALNLQLEPFQLPATNSVLLVTPSGSVAGGMYWALGSLQLDRNADRLAIGFADNLEIDVQVVVLTNGQVAHTRTVSGMEFVTVGTNARVGSIAAHAKTVEFLPGFHVQFAEPTDITVSGVTITGDEVRLLLPPPARLENLHSLYFAGRYIGPLTITNEIVSPPEPPARLQIARAGENVLLSWADPNRLLRPAYADYGGPEGPYFYLTNEVVRSDPYASVSVPIVKTNAFTFFQLFYSPDE